MKLSLLAAAAIAPLASAHYFFDTLVIDGQESTPNQYVRSNTRPEKYNPTKWKETRDDMTPDMTDFRCNKGAFESAGQTETAEVQAGSKLAMKLGVGATMQHPGPGLVYMSKAPDAANQYEGEGDWFKIHEEGICDTSKDIKTDAWCTYDKDRIEFTIPADVPDGEYLIRPEHIGVHGAHDGQAEFYYECAQVKVTGGGNGSPEATIQFPGGYKKDDPSFNFSVWGGMKDYPMPGPPVWSGSGSGSSSSSGSSSGSSTASASAPASASTSAAASNGGDAGYTGGWPQQQQGGDAGYAGGWPQQQDAGNADYAGGWPQQKQANTCDSGAYQRRHVRDFAQ